LLISPDSQLNLVPFEALVDEQNQYLVTSFSISYLSSGRDLLRMNQARKSQSPPLIIADPLFGEPRGGPIASRAPASNAGAKVRRKSSGTGSTDFSSVYFSPLIGSALEANEIKLRFPDSTVITGAGATESALKQAVAPSLLHIATHGFFLAGSPEPPGSITLRQAGSLSDKAGSGRGASGTRAISANVKIGNPLLRSGLALAGANLHTGTADDGILTALEATGLNLWGTRLVTLSACDTGIGEVKIGEGVYGLRRAFVLAGTESLIMSLWPVSDAVTRELMAAYYTGLKGGLGRGEALRQVQLSMLKRKARQHPFYWASFIQSGDWANLEGKR
jgi:CHAT domain-containing protein